MAQIETYTSRGNLQPAGTPQVQLVNPVAQEVEQIGGQISGYAAQLKQRQEEKENFKVENDYRRLQLELDQKMTEQAATIADDGAGFHDKFLTDIYKPTRDQFLTSVPDRLKPKFETLLSDAGGADTANWSIKAGTVERDQGYLWQRDQLKLTTEQMATAIDQNPDGYDDYLKSGTSLIEMSTLPTPEKMKLKTEWENAAQVSYLNKLLADDPSGVLRDLGYDARNLSPTTQFELLSRAVQWQESADNPQAVSGKGAVGLMQVMPATAVDIAKKLGDPNFPGASHPFDPAVNTPRPNADGSVSTEITRTVQLPDGSWANVPSLWWGQGSDVKDMGRASDDELAQRALAYEQASGQAFPRFTDLGAAEAAAKARSAQGGGEGASITGGTTEEAIKRYLTNPALNKQYGEFYLRQQLRTFQNTRNPVETALVAYNGGPGLAQKWVESGYDDKVLPKETRDYKTEILSTLKADPVKGDPASVSVVGKTDGVSADLVDRTKDAFATLGLTKIKVTSGFRDEAKNKSVGGADKSQHLTGNAMDLDVSGMSNADKIELIKALSNSGVTGIGVYANSIHVDLGGRRAWGPSYGAESIPGWAKGVLGQHLNGTMPPSRAVNQRFASLPYDQRQQFVGKADQAVTALANATQKASAAEKVQVKQDMENELALVRSTGSGSQTFDATNVSTLLGEDDYMRFAHDVEVARKTYTATQGIATMLPEEWDQRYNDYAADPAAPNFYDQQQVQAAVQKEIEKNRSLRANSPDQAALTAYPELKASYDDMRAALQDGNFDPAQAQTFVQQMQVAQSALGIAREAQAPIPRGFALEIGRGFSTLPAYDSKANIAEVQAAVAQEYATWKAVFGDYADEVITYALSEYKGISKDQATVLSQLVVQARDGKGPYRPKHIDQSADNQQLTTFSGQPYGQTPALDYWFGGAAPPDAVGPDGLSPEERIRANQSTEE